MFIMTQKETPRDNSMSVLCGCGKENKFFGVACPLACRSCSEMLPNALDLYYSKKERIVYSLDETIFN